MKQKNRYIVAFYALKPRRGAPTHLKGWMNDSNNLQWDENFAMREGLKNKDMTEAQVILDLDNKKVLKNWKADEGDGGMDFDKLYEYYEKNYGKYIEDFMKKSDKHRAASISSNG